MWFDAQLQNARNEIEHKECKALQRLQLHVTNNACIAVYLGISNDNKPQCYCVLITQEEADYLIFKIHNAL